VAWEQDWGISNNKQKVTKTDKKRKDRKKNVGGITTLSRGDQTRHRECGKGARGEKKIKLIKRKSVQRKKCTAKGQPVGKKSYGKTTRSALRGRKPRIEK